MDHFERRLARMMRDSEEHSPFGPRHRERLREGVAARRRARAAQRAAGSLLAVAGLVVGLLLLPGGPDRAEPAGPLPRPATSPQSSGPGPTPTPDASTQPALPAGPTGTTTPPYSTSHPPSGTPDPADSTDLPDPPGAPTSTARTGP
ncbi:cellulase [Streptomyces sp. NPDC002309]